jgi:hypothetical protein
MGHHSQVNRVEQAKRAAEQRELFNKHPSWILPNKERVQLQGTVRAHTPWKVEDAKEKEEVCLKLSIPKL